MKMEEKINKLKSIVEEYDNIEELKYGVGMSTVSKIKYQL